MPIINELTASMSEQSESFEYIHTMTVSDGIITGVYSSVTPLTPEILAKISNKAGHDIVVVGATTEYQEGRKFAEYTQDGILRPLIDRINEGLTEVPHDMELIDGALVPKTVTPEEAPVTLQQKLNDLTTQNASIVLQNEAITLKNATLEAESKLQTAQINALTAQNVMYEELIMELAQEVWK